jgi:hypothetical protein
MPDEKLASNPNKNELASRGEPASSLADKATRDNNSKASIAVEAIAKFLEENSSRDPKKQRCNICGSPMQFFEACFWLDGADLGSILPLPFCSNCDQDVLKSVRRRSSERSTNRLN